MKKLEKLVEISESEFVTKIYDALKQLEAEKESYEAKIGELLQTLRDVEFYKQNYSLKFFYDLKSGDVLYEKLEKKKIGFER